MLYERAIHGHGGVECDRDFCGFFLQSWRHPDQTFLAGAKRVILQMKPRAGADENRTRLRNTGIMTPFFVKHKHRNIVENCLNLAESMVGSDSALSIYRAIVF